MVTQQLSSSGTAISVLVGFGVLVLCYVVLLLWKKWLSLKSISSCPGPKTTFLFGNVLQFKHDGAEFYDQIIGWSSAFWDKGLFSVWFGSFHPMVFTFKPELAEIILSSSRQITKSFEYDLLLPWLGTGLLISTGDKWKKRRRLITPTFHFKILNDFIQVFEDKSKTMVSILKPNCNDGPIDMFPKVTLCALDIICETSMGKPLDAQREGNSTYVNAILSMSDLVMTRVKKPWFYSDWLYSFSQDGKLSKKYLDILHGFTNMVIDERIAERKSQEPKEKEVDEFTGKRKRRLVAFLDLLLDAYDDGQIDKEGVREEVDTFMFEGHDTTAAGMSWAILRLGENPDVQRKAQEEVDAFFESRPETLTVDSLKELKYLECVIKESLRLHPSVPFFGRKIIEDITMDGFQIPTGTTIAIAPMSLHRNPNVWPEPNKFDPDRFLPENSEGRHPYAYVPFSAGPRNCIGQKFALLEEKVILAYILHNFNIKSEMSPEDVKMTAEIIGRPKNGIPVSLSLRN